MSYQITDTEHLILSYLRSHSPEECMLDKISLGTGKSRATVLKYLNILHARSILEYKIIGRNKLWLIHESSEIIGEKKPFNLIKKSPDNLSTLVSKVSDLHELTLRKMDLQDYLDHSDRIVLTISPDFTIITENQLFSSSFPDSYSFRELILPDLMKRVEHLVRSAFLGETIESDIELLEKTGITRMYRVTFVPSKEKKSSYLIVIGEDISSVRTQKQQEALLYLIRSTAGVNNRDELFSLMMNGINNSLLPYRYGIIFLSGHIVAYSSVDVSTPLLEFVYPLLDRVVNQCETQIIRISNYDMLNIKFTEGFSQIKHLVIVPLLEDEKTIGNIVFFVDHDIRSMDVDNVEIIADEIANVLKMQRLEQERSELIRTLETINRISEILNSNPDEKSLLGKTIDLAIDTLGFDMGCVYLMDEDEDLIPTVKRNMPDKLQELCLSGQFSSLFEKACKNHSVLYIRSNDPEFSMIDQDVQDLDMKTILILPIIFGKKVIGLLNMGSKEEKMYQKTSLDNISSLGLQLGMALERTRLAQNSLNK